ncbi:hypothetical protein ES705_34651 [subsurface metagenome]
MMHCINAVPTVANLHYYVKIVKDCSYGVIAEFCLLVVTKEYKLEMSPKANMRRLEANMNRINTMKFRTNSHWRIFHLTNYFSYYSNW